MILIGLLFLLLFLHSDISLFVLLAIGVFIMQSLIAINLGFLQAEMRSVAHTILNCGSNLFAFIFGLLFLLFYHNVEALLVGIIIGNFLIFALTYQLNNRWNKVRLCYFSYSILKDFLKYTGPLLFNSGFTYLINNVDRWLLVILLTVNASGLYSAAVNFPQFAIVSLINVIYLSVYPFIISAHKSFNKKETKKFLSLQLFMFVMLILPVCLAFIALNHNIVYLIFGKSFRSTSSYLMVPIIIAVLLYGIKYTYTDLSFLLSGRTFRQFKITLFMLGANIILNIVLIPRFGLLGSVVALIVTNSIGLLMSLVLGRRYLKLVFPFRKIVRIIIPSLIMFMVLLFMRDMQGLYYFILQLAVGICVYFGALLLFNRRLVVEVINAYKQKYLKV